MIILRRAWSLLSSKDKPLFIKNLAINLIEPFWSFFSLISLIPFLYMVINPEIVTTQKHLAYIRKVLGIENQDTFLILVGCFAFGILILANLYNLFLAKQNAKFTNDVHCSISSRIFEYNLTQDFIETLACDPTQIRNMILRYSIAISEFWIMGLIRLTAALLSVFLIVATILFAAPAVAAMTITVFGLFYFLVYVVVRKKLKTLGFDTNIANKELQRITTEPFNALKEVFIFNKANDFLTQYRRLVGDLGAIKTSTAVTSLVPRYAIEVLAFGALLLTTIFMLSTEGSASETIPVVGIFAYACQKLAPALRLAFTILTSMRFNISSLNEVHEMLQKHAATSSPVSIQRPLGFNRNLRLIDVAFQYPGTSKFVFTDVNLQIEKGAVFGIIGVSGRGKTTLVNMIAGVIPPTHGKILVDGFELSPANVIRWRQNIGYVGQDIFLFDSTIGRNIAFSFYGQTYDEDKVIAAAKNAGIHEYIAGLELGYDTPVGQNGLRLSGGQKQRVAIARALYKEADILILDEATNALDDSCEELVFSNLASQLKNKTVILITHNAKSVERCDSLFKFEEFLDIRAKPGLPGEHILHS